MTHLEGFRVRHYRGIDGLSFDNLTQANLITGSNGVGKTAVIEAMWLFAGRYNSHLLWNANVQRSRDPIVDPISELTATELDISGIEDGVRQRYQVSYRGHVSDPEEAVTTRVSDPARLPIIGQILSKIDGTRMQGESLPRPTPKGAVLSTVRHIPGRAACIIEGTAWPLDAQEEQLTRYSELVKQGHKEDLKAAMSMILPKIRDIEILTDEGGRSYLSAVTISGDRLPLKDLGGGIVRLFRLYLSFFTVRGGIVFFDEIESGIHYSVLPSLWERIRSWVTKWDVQAVATTHSAELIDAAISAFRDTPEDLSIHQLFLDDRTGKIDVTTFSGETLEGALELNLEVR